MFDSLQICPVTSETVVTTITLKLLCIFIFRKVLILSHGMSKFWHKTIPGFLTYLWRYIIESTSKGVSDVTVSDIQALSPSRIARKIVNIHCHIFLFSNVTSYYAKNYIFFSIPKLFPKISSPYMLVQKLVNFMSRLKQGYLRADNK